jgi:hypothetical protein
MLRSLTAILLAGLFTVPALAEEFTGKECIAMAGKGDDLGNGAVHGDS